MVLELSTYSQGHVQWKRLKVQSAAGNRHDYSSIKPIASQK